MLNHHSNPSDNSETDHLQAAAIMVTARRKEQEAAELSTTRPPARTQTQNWSLSKRRATIA